MFCEYPLETKGQYFSHLILWEHRIWERFEWNLFFRTLCENSVLMSTIFRYVFDKRFVNKTPNKRMTFDATLIYRCFAVQYNREMRSKSLFMSENPKLFSSVRNVFFIELKTYFVYFVWDSDRLQSDLKFLRNVWKNTQILVKRVAIKCFQQFSQQ